MSCALVLQLNVGEARWKPVPLSQLQVQAMPTRPAWTLGGVQQARPWVPVRLRRLPQTATSTMCLPLALRPLRHPLPQLARECVAATGR